MSSDVEEYLNPPSSCAWYHHRSHLYEETKRRSKKKIRRRSCSSLFLPLSFLPLAHILSLSFNFFPQSLDLTLFVPPFFPNVSVYTCLPHTIYLLYPNSFLWSSFYIISFNARTHTLSLSIARSPTVNKLSIPHSHTHTHIHTHFLSSLSFTHSSVPVSLLDERKSVGSTKIKAIHAQIFSGYL